MITSSNYYQEFLFFYLFVSIDSFFSVVGEIYLSHSLLLDMISDCILENKQIKDVGTRRWFSG